MMDRRQETEDRRQNTEYRRPKGAFRTPRSGFSLLEVLLATTVLIIIIMIVSVVFQQTHTAWTSGSKRAEMETVLRSMLGLMERDLTHAIDATQFPTTPPGSIVNEFNPFENVDNGGITFVTLDGTNRVPLYVEYTLQQTPFGYNLQRISQPIIPVPNTTNWQLGTANAPSILNGQFGLCRFRVDVTNAPPGSASTNLPVRVDITAQLVVPNQFAMLSGRSYGPDGVPDSATPGAKNDDIVVSP